MADNGERLEARLGNRSLALSVRDVFPVLVLLLAGVGGYTIWQQASQELAAQGRRRSATRPPPRRASTHQSQARQSRETSRERGGMRLRLVHGVAVCLLALLGTGCHGQLVDALERREVASCLWFSGPFARGVTATGGVPLEACLAVCHPLP